ncbi:MAG: hypothetical protein JXB00_09715 [Bacteroidales bacterium]|nr:hypothetical protein [Bacteroidales bacterium]
MFKKYETDGVLFPHQFYKFVVLKNLLTLLNIESMRAKMMKTLIGAIAALLLVGMVSMEAKSQLFSVGQKDVNLGIGFGSYYILGKTVIPPISVSLDYGFKDDIGPGVLSIGGYFGFTSSKYKMTYYLYNDNYGRKYTEIMAGARSTYHVEFIDNLDTYAGIILGLRIRTESNYGEWPSAYEPASDAGLFPGYGFFVGGKYYFQDNLAVFCELGYSIAYLNLGVTFKL